MTKFKIGDSVNVYGLINDWIPHKSSGIIRNIKSDPVNGDIIFVDIFKNFIVDNNKDGKYTEQKCKNWIGTFNFHEKQCRKLVKRKKNLGNHPGEESHECQSLYDHNGQFIKDRKLPEIPSHQHNICEVKDIFDDKNSKKIFEEINNTIDTSLKFIESNKIKILEEKIEYFDHKLDDFANSIDVIEEKIKSLEEGFNNMCVNNINHRIDAISSS